MSNQQVWIAGEWRSASATGNFHAENPATGQRHPEDYPVSAWSDLDAALTAAAQAVRTLRDVPAEKLSSFLEHYATLIATHAAELAELASSETGLAVRPRLLNVEIPRTTTQLRQAAHAAQEGSWQHCVLDSKLNIRSHLAAIGPVLVLGPNNFPFAFNGISGGDFAAAIAAGNPVIAKAHPLHPGTTLALARLAAEALQAADLPQATVQLLYHMSAEDGMRLVSDRRLGAIAFTGSRTTGLRIKAAADSAGIPACLEMSSLNPVVVLPGALHERSEKLAGELADSCLAASGQFCTSPNLILLIDGEPAEAFIAALKQSLAQRPVAPLLSSAGLASLQKSVQALVHAGATLLTGGADIPGDGYRFQNTLLRVNAAGFLRDPEAMQHEAFGNATLIVTVANVDQLIDVIHHLEGNLTGSIYTSAAGEDDAAYAAVAPALRSRVGRLLNDKMPTGVALSPAMNHGGPYPSTGHPLFTSVGIPGSMARFAALQCYDNVGQQRLPAVLRDEAPHPDIWRSIDGNWVRG